MSPDEHAAVQSLLGAFALDAVDAEERALVDAHLLTCGSCRAEVGDHREVAAVLAGIGAAAPDHLWDRLAADLAGGDELSPHPRVVDLGRARMGRDDGRRAPRRPLAVVGVAAAAVVAIAVVAGATVMSQQREIDDLAARVDEASSTTTLGTQVAELSSAGGEVALSAVVAGEEGFLAADELEPLEPGRTYQLWGITDGQARSLGLLGPDPGLETFVVEGGTTTLAITEEDQSGAEQPTSDPLVAGDLT